MDQISRFYFFILYYSIYVQSYDLVFFDYFRNGPGGVWESGSESGCANDGVGFSRDAVGRRSMSEKRHAAMDAKNTGTYKKLKEQRNANNGTFIKKIYFFHCQFDNNYF